MSNVCVLCVYFNVNLTCNQRKCELLFFFFFLQISYQIIKDKKQCPELSGNRHPQTSWRIGTTGTTFLKSVW